MSLSVTFVRKEQIEEARQRLKLQKRAKKLTSETIADTRESQQSKLDSLRERLEAAQAVALQFRDELLTVETDQGDTLGEISELKMEIAILKNDCETLERRAVESREELERNLEELNCQYQEVVEELEEARKVIEQYGDELIEQDGKLDVLTRELGLARHRYKMALTTFRDDG
jgi:chromosome segregation ATPase